MSDSTCSTRAAASWPTTREMMQKLKPFARERVARSWLHVASTLLILATLVALTFHGPIWFRVIASIASGLVTVRAFILYHDHFHGALLKDSRLMRVLMSIVGALVLTPVNAWVDTHNYHHANTAKIVGSHVGSYMMVTTEMWREMTPGERFAYRLVRHPLTIFGAYFTVFLYGMTIASFLRNPRKYWDSLPVLLAHIALSIALIMTFGWLQYVLTLLVPLWISMMMGAYLFYAQHNFPEVYVQPREAWEYTRAAMESSSYMEMNPVLEWITGNIGYHHIHHLHPQIPFYRLPEVMARVPEVQNPRGRTSLSPVAIYACFRQKLWDSSQGKMVPYP